MEKSSCVSQHLVGCDKTLEGSTKRRKSLFHANSRGSARGLLTLVSGLCRGRASLQDAMMEQDYLHHDSWEWGMLRKRVGWEGGRIPGAGLKVYPSKLCLQCPSAKATLPRVFTTSQGYHQLGTKLGKYELLEKLRFQNTTAVSLQKLPRKDAFQFLDKASKQFWQLPQTSVRLTQRWTSTSSSLKPREIKWLQVKCLSVGHWLE